MRLVNEVRGRAGGGLEGDVESSPSRGVTLLARRQWEQVMAELGRDLPWHTRRANVLIDADSLAHLIGRTIALGELMVAIAGETQPCRLMDEQCPGLKNALRPDCRAGVHGRILQGGRLAVGDWLELLAPPT